VPEIVKVIMMMIIAFSYGGNFHMHSMWNHTVTCHLAAAASPAIAPAVKGWYSPPGINLSK